MQSRNLFQCTLEKTEEVIKNEQSRDTGNYELKGFFFQWCVFIFCIESKYYLNHFRFKYTTNLPTPNNF